MALVNVNNVLVLDNPSPYSSPFRFEITFECLQELDDDLEWKVLWISDHSTQKNELQDIVLEEVCVGPVPVGRNQFVLIADPPTVPRVRLGVTVLLLTCSYKEREFVRIGYYVNHALTSSLQQEHSTLTHMDTNSSHMDTNKSSNNTNNNNEEDEDDIIPEDVEPTLVTRQILADKPRVTKFPIPWGDEPFPRMVPLSLDSNSNNNNNTPGMKDTALVHDNMEDVIDEDIVDEEDDDEEEEDDEEDEEDGEDEVDLEETMD